MFSSTTVHHLPKSVATRGITVEVQQITKVDSLDERFSERSKAQEIHAVV
jgi:hypothetical protein